MKKSNAIILILSILVIIEFMFMVLGLVYYFRTQQLVTNLVGDNNSRATVPTVSLSPTLEEKANM